MKKENARPGKGGTTKEKEPKHQRNSMPKGQDPKIQVQRNQTYQRELRTRLQ